MHKPFDRVAAEQRVPLDMVRAEVCQNMAPGTPFSQPSVALPDQIADQSQYTTARRSRNRREARGKAKSCWPARKLSVSSTGGPFDIDGAHEDAVLMGV